MTIKKIFVLDSNVLMHDPSAFFRFKHHDVYLPIVVLEELDAAKKGMSEVARNVRQASRFLSDLIEKGDSDIKNGLALPSHARELAAGRLYFYLEEPESSLPALTPGTPDNTLLAITLDLDRRHPDRPVVLVTKDINLRIKAHALGIKAEDYTNDQTLDDANLLYSGVEALSSDFWQTHGSDMESWKSEGRTFYRVRGPGARRWRPNQFVFTEGERPFQAVVRKIEDDGAILEIVKDYGSERNAVWGITARNREQNFALNLLMDPDIDFITLLGHAGTGKTLLTLAAALAQTLEAR